MEDIKSYWLTKSGNPDLMVKDPRFKHIPTVQYWYYAILSTRSGQGSEIQDAKQEILLMRHLIRSYPNLDVLLNLWYAFFATGDRKYLSDVYWVSESPIASPKLREIARKKYILYSTKWPNPIFQEVMTPESQYAYLPEPRKPRYSNPELINSKSHGSCVKSGTKHSRKSEIIHIGSYDDLYHDPCNFKTGDIFDIDTLIASQQKKDWSEWTDRNDYFE